MPYRCHGQCRTSQVNGHVVVKDGKLLVLVWRASGLIDLLTTPSGYDREGDPFGPNDMRIICPRCLHDCVWDDFFSEDDYQQYDDEIPLIGEEGLC